MTLRNCRSIHSDDCCSARPQALVAHQDAGVQQSVRERGARQDRASAGRRRQAGAASAELRVEILADDRRVVERRGRRP